VRRLLDIVACTTSFGSCGKQAKVKPSSHEPGKVVAHGASSPAGIMAEVTGNLPTTTGEDSESVRKEVDAQVSESTSKAEIDKAAFTKSEKTVFSGKPEAVAAMTAAKEATEKGDMTGMCPPSKLGLFNEFLSFSYLRPPLQCQYFFT
jgi:hypothetical protein